MSTALKSIKDNDFLKPGDSICGSNKQLMESPEVEEVERKVIKQEDIQLGPASVGYLLVYPNISKKTAAKTKKAGREITFYSGHHYLVEVSGELWDMLDDEMRYMLVYNQLLHINPVYKAKRQEWVFKIRKPEVTEYYEIADKRGVEHIKAIQSTQSSLYDLDPADERQVSLF